MGMINVTELRKGMIFRLEGELYRVAETNHVTPGNWRGMVQCKMRSIKTGSTKQQRFGTGEKVEQVASEAKEMEYLYESGGTFYFMDQNTYEENPVPAEMMEDQKGFLLPNTMCLLQYIDGDLVGVDLPTTVVLLVKETDPALKGATVTNQYKAAVMETGVTIQVPPFVAEGEKIKVDTRTGEYVERVKE
ncbi:MAG: elongation factor P [Candidatus Brocadiae bacterium]|nr:elongation factor P [Candidatus Brocadiia bacterium]